MATFMNESIIIGSDRPTAKGPWPGVALLVILAVVGLVSWRVFGAAPVAAPIPVIPVATTTPTLPTVSEVALVFLDNAAPDAGQGDYGCDGIVTVRVPVQPTPAPVTAAMAALFGEATTTDLTPGNFVAAQGNLKFDRAVVDGATARVYLTGTPTYGGECDDPRLTVQIRETVLANAPAVEKVEIFLNGAPYVVPSEKGEE